MLARLPAALILICGACLADPASDYFQKAFKNAFPSPLGDYDSVRPAPGLPTLMGPGPGPLQQFTIEVPQTASACAIPLSKVTPAPEHYAMRAYPVPPHSDDGIKKAPLAPECPPEK